MELEVSEMIYLQIYCRSISLSCYQVFQLEVRRLSTKLDLIGIQELCSQQKRKYSSRIP
jgi:hypothetical protein